MNILLDNTCRVCLISNPYSLYYDINQHSAKLGKIIAVAIMECATVKIRANDGFPDQICENCLRQLFHAQNFKGICCRSDSVQLDYCNALDHTNKSQDVKSDEEICNNQSTTEETNNSHMRCYKCNSSLENFESLKLHERSECSRQSKIQQNVSWNTFTGDCPPTVVPSADIADLLPTPPTQPPPVGPLYGPFQPPPVLLEIASGVFMSVPHHVIHSTRTWAALASDNQRWRLRFSRNGKLRRAYPTPVKEMCCGSDAVQLDYSNAGDYTNKSQIKSDEETCNNQSTAEETNNSRMRCDKCNSSMGNLESLKLHEQLGCSRQSKIQQNVFQSTFTGDQSLITNPVNSNTNSTELKNTGKKKKYTCPKCQKHYETPEETRIHVLTCDLTCMCGKKFKSVGVLHRHKRVLGCLASKKYQKRNKELNITFPINRNKIEDLTKITCWGCNLPFDNINLLFEHKNAGCKATKINGR